MLDETIKEEILELAYGIVDDFWQYNANPNGPDTFECRFCASSVNDRGALTAYDIKHREDCLYLKAKSIIKKYETD